MPITKSTQLLGARQAAKINRQRAIDAYNENPNRCRFCKKVIPVMDHQKVKDVRQKKYCNRSCAASLNNRAHPKRQLQGICEFCGIPIHATHRFCSRKCWNSGWKKDRKIKTRKQILQDRARAVVTWRQRTKRKAVEYKGGKCCRCGYDRSIRALTFHHLDPTKKDFSLSKASRSWDSVVKEVDKCVLLCSNCHAEYHDGFFELPDSK